MRIGSGFGMPPVVKNLLIINVLVYIVAMLFESNDFSLTWQAGLFYFDSPNFKPYQIITHMFMHGGIFHIAFNMFGLWMFGSALEAIWGPKRFLIYYLICGLGAALLHTGVNAFSAYQISGSVINELDVVLSNPELTSLYRTPTVGASGAIMGILIGFGLTFPNQIIMLIIPPIPIKAKYFIWIYAALELYLGFQRFEGDNIAHFAHLGGMLVGFILIKMWRLKPQ